jgi:hypothetical protein
VDEPSKYQKVKRHVLRHQVRYAAGGSVVVAGFTCLIMRDVISLPISRGSAVTADRGIAVVGKKVVMNNVSYISADRQGPPSWVVRCKETGNVFTSQRSAALEMGLPANELSQHLNGLREHVYGNHFERLCLAV